MVRKYLRITSPSCLLFCDSIGGDLSFTGKKLLGRSDGKSGGSSLQLII